MSGMFIPTITLRNIKCIGCDLQSKGISIILQGNLKVLTAVTVKMAVLWVVAPVHMVLHPKDSHLQFCQT
jgi:hypothetical protein